MGDFALHRCSPKLEPGTDLLDGEQVRGWLFGVELTAMTRALNDVWQAARPPQSRASRGLWRIGISVAGVNSVHGSQYA